MVVFAGGEAAAPAAEEFGDGLRAESGVENFDLVRRDERGMIDAAGAAEREQLLA